MTSYINIHVRRESNESLETILKCKHLFISRVRIEISLLCGELSLINACYMMLSGRCDI